MLDISESTEMYLETILLLERSHGHAHGVEIARKLGVSKASVTKAMKKLRSDGLVEKENYGSITLTEKGVELSTAVYAKHKLICTFFMRTLGVSKSVASENACRMEHIVTEELLESMEKYLDDNFVEV